MFYYKPLTSCINIATVVEEIACGAHYLAVVTEEISTEYGTS